jgi:cytidylate kinase
MKERGFSEKRAQKYIVKPEREHRKLVKKYFDADIHDPTRYHLVVNTALLSPESIVRIVKGIIEDETSSHCPIP